MIWEIPQEFPVSSLRRMREAHFCSYNVENKRFETKPGAYHIYVGKSVSDIGPEEEIFAGGCNAEMEKRCSITCGFAGVTRNYFCIIINWPD